MGSSIWKPLAWRLNPNIKHHILVQNSFAVKYVVKYVTEIKFLANHIQFLTEYDSDVTLTVFCRFVSHTNICIR